MQNMLDVRAVPGTKRSVCWGIGTGTRLLLGGLWFFVRAVALAVLMVVGFMAAMVVLGMMAHAAAIWVGMGWRVF